MWVVLAFPSRAVNALTGGRPDMTLCRQSLEPDAPLWLLVLAALVEFFHRGHLAWTTDTP